MIGGSSLINMGIGMVRTKFVALLLGPSGMGLMGVYTAISGMVGTISSMGIGTSGVREIAEAHGSGDQDRIARTVKTLRRTVWVTGLLGMLIMMLGSTLLSSATFGSTEHALSIALIGITILLGNITAGQSCLLQGTRRIKDLAKVSVIGALNGTAISIPCYYFWGKAGIVPSLLLTAAAALGTSWWYARRVSVKPIELSWRESREDAGRLLRLGIPLMLAGLMTALSGYVIRILLIRQVGLEGVGIYLAAFTFSEIVVNFVLQAMGTDYYPRLTGLAHDDKLVNESVNSQTEISLLLAVPGLAATIVFAPLVITIFYSGKFDAAVDILRWSVYGIFGRIVSWPLGFIMLAKGMGKTFFCSETIANLLHIAAIWGCTKLWDLSGAGIAFLLLYAIYTPFVCTIGYAVARVTWNRVNQLHILAFGTVLAVVGLINVMIASIWYQYVVNSIILSLVSLYCFWRLSKKSGVAIGSLFGNRKKCRWHMTDKQYDLTDVLRVGKNR